MSEQPWLSIDEVPADEFDRYVRQRSPARSGGRWEELYRQIYLRLERTPPRRALSIRFPTRREAKRAFDSIKWQFNRWYGPNFVELAVRQEDGGEGLLLVRRGEGYRKPKYP